MVQSAELSSLNELTPLCPEWRIRDVVGHLVGISQDIAAGNFPGDLDEWAAAQVERNHDADLATLLEEWPTYELERFITPELDRKSTRLNSSHIPLSRMPSSA